MEGGSDEKVPKRRAGIMNGDCGDPFNYFEYKITKISI
jgi:hypothetical protein